MHLNLKIYFFITVAISCSLAFSQELKPTQIFEQNSKSIVLIVTFDNQGVPIAQGSGVVLPNDMIATNCHVVSKSSLIGIGQSDERRLARVTETFPESDLCVLTADSPIGKPVRLAIGKPQAGEKVYTLGHPQGLDITISEGLISGFRSIPRGEYIQFSAAISAGSSGGGLFNSSGDLVGITTLSRRESQNINFAASVDILKNVLKKMVGNSLPSSGSNQPMTVSVASAITSNAPPVPEFKDSNQRIDYLRWLERHNDKLIRAKPDFLTRREFLMTVWYESQRAGLKPELVLALIETLSQYRKFHVSPNGARGYMQIDPKWTRILGDGDVGKLFYSQTNLRFGCVLLRHQIEVANGDVEVGVKHYLVEASGLKLDESSLDTLVRTVFFTKSVLES